MELGVAALEVRRVRRVAHRVDLIPPHARASHPGVDLQVKGALAARGPLGDRPRVAKHWREPEAIELVEQPGLPRHEHDHGAGDPGRAQLGPFVDRRDPVAPGVDPFQGLRHGDGSHPVGVGLHHREEPRAGDPGHRAGVLDDGGEVHLDPRTGGGLTPAD